MEHFAVFTIQKEAGTSGGGGMSAHIDRQVWDGSKYVPFVPKSVIDQDRDRLNKDYLLPKGVGRSEAIANRLKEAGITRKVRKDQVRSFTIICQSSHIKMKEIENQGKLDEWAADCIAYCQKTFGAKNVVAAALHMGEKTPHLHITVVPIVHGEAKPRKPTKAEAERTTPKRRYKRQLQETRLCCKEVTSRTNLKRYQTDFAQAMGKWGMVRGIEGSDAKRVDPALWNEFQRQLQDLKDQIKTSEEDYKSLKSKNQQLQVVNTMKKAGVALGEGVAAVGEAAKGVFGQSKKDKKIEKLENQVKQLTTDKKTLQASVKTKIQEGLAAAKTTIDKLTWEKNEANRTIDRLTSSKNEAVATEQRKAAVWREMCEKLWPSAVIAVKDIVTRITSRQTAFTILQMRNIDKAMSGARSIEDRIEYGQDLMAMANQDLPDKIKGGSWFQSTSQEVEAIARSNGNLEQLQQRSQRGMHL